MSASYESAIEVQCFNNGIGKRAYGSSGDAKKAAKHTMAMHGGRAMTVYKCCHCARWHVGHVTPWRKRQASVAL